MRVRGEGKRVKVGRGESESVERTPLVVAARSPIPRLASPCIPIGSPVPAGPRLPVSPPPRPCPCLSLLRGNAPHSPTLHFFRQGSPKLSLEEE